VLAALVAGKAEPQASTATGGEAAPDIGLALVFVLYAYGGWSHAAYVAAEVRDQRRNLPRALVLGLACITLVYLAVNAAYLAVLGFGGASRTQTPAAEVIDHAFGLWGGRALSLLVMLSALGAINGMILTGTRIYAVWGADYPMLRWLGVWNRTAAVPTAAIAVQAAIAAGLILLVGTAGGHAVFDAALRSVGIRELSWAYYAGGFETLVAGSAPVYWTLSLATGVAILVLRARDRSVERPFTMPVYPLPALVFCGTCLYMLQASLAHAKWLSLIGFIPLGVGGVVWALIRVRS
jgi:amino acid transporter